MIIKWCIAAIALSFNTEGLTQINASSDFHKSPKIGEKVPEIKFSHLVNFPRRTAKLSEFADRLVILDAWATWCGPCIAAFPKIDSLQRRYRDKVQFIPCTGEDTKKIEKFFERVNRKWHFVIPSSVGDDSFFGIFTDSSGHSVGSYVWIYKGVLIARTGKEEVTEENIKLALEGKLLEQKSSKQIGKRLPHDFSKPWLLEETKGTDFNLLYHSSFRKYIRHLAASDAYELPAQNGSGAGIRIINLPLSHMYYIAYRIPTYKWIIEEIRDVQKFRPSNPHTESDTSNLYCYELVTQGDFKGDIHKVMQGDLQRVFGFVVKKEKRKVNCLIVKRTNDRAPITKGEKKLLEKSNFYIHYINQPLEQLVNDLSYYLYDCKGIRFIFDETDIKGNIDISIDADLSDVLALSKELRKFGLDVVEEMREVEMWVISDPK
jgi:thiol-disulfide isomerase/thioredoxin